MHPLPEMRPAIATAGTDGLKTRQHRAGRDDHDFGAIVAQAA